MTHNNHHFQLTSGQKRHFHRLFHSEHNSVHFKILLNNYYIFSKYLKIGEIVPVDKYVIFRLSDENRHTIREVFDLNDDISHIEFDSVLGQLFRLNS